jgi:hypothetical protein
MQMSDAEAVIFLELMRTDKEGMLTILEAMALMQLLLSDDAAALGYRPDNIRDRIIDVRQRLDKLRAKNAKPVK